MTRSVLLGASNLRTALPRVVALLAAGPTPDAAATSATDDPHEILVACGHGRSYGARSTFLGVRSLPGIVECGLWPALRQRQPTAPGAGGGLLTDLGNDLAYGFSVDRVLRWVTLCLDRLAAAGLDGPAVTLVAPPVASLERMGRRRFAVARRVLFPARSLDLDRLLHQTRRLEHELGRLAADRGYRLVEPDPGWYAWDRIHVRSGRREDAWREMLGGMVPDGAGDWGSGALLPARWWLHRAEGRWLGRTRRTEQPAVEADGVRVELY